MQRKMAAILIGDIVNSTSRMAADEEAMVACFASCLEAVSGAVAAHEGRVFNTAGDSILAEFNSPVNALRASMAARGSLAGVDGITPGDMRFGLHVADVLWVDDDLRGDGINLTARIQSAALPGEIHVSSMLYEQVRRNSPCVFEDLGEQLFKGIEEPIRIYPTLQSQLFVG